MVGSVHSYLTRSLPTPLLCLPLISLPYSPFSHSTPSPTPNPSLLPSRIVSLFVSSYYFIHPPLYVFLSLPVPSTSLLPLLHLPSYFSVLRKVRSKVRQEVLSVSAQVKQKSHVQFSLSIHKHTEFESGCSRRKRVAMMVEGRSSECFRVD